MKVGILTFQFSMNYGAQLQCYALKEFLKQHGHEVKVINLQFKEKSPYRGLGWKKSFFQASKNAFYKFKYYKKLKRNINNFRFQYLNLTDPCNINTIGIIANDFDAIVFGSDQIWGPSFHDSKVFFGKWIPPYKGIKISYSPCCAMNKVAESNVNELTFLLNSFNKISVRNLETQNFVYRLIQKYPPITLDPTLLYEFDEFKCHSISPKYILTYIIGKEIKGGHDIIIKKIRETFGNIPVYSIILTSQTQQTYSWMDKTFWDLDPIKWMQLIQNSSFLYTDSFHGLIFALKLNIPALAYYSEDKRASRFIDLANRYKMNEIIASSANDAIERNCIRKTINYQSIREAINPYKSFSEEFLLNSLK